MQKLPKREKIRIIQLTNCNFDITMSIEYKMGKDSYLFKDMSRDSE